jgi:hypothetical protein
MLNLTFSRRWVEIANFVRKPEFMGFNGYDDGINRTQFNPLAWGDQNATRLKAWVEVRDEEIALARRIPADARDAYFELVGYTVEAAAAQNAKFPETDRSFLDAHRHENTAVDAATAIAAYERIQALTAQYNGLTGGKWNGMMSDAPRQRHVFEMPRTATDAGDSVDTISPNAAEFARKNDGTLARWVVMPELGISGATVEYGAPGLLGNAAPAAARDVKVANAPWLEYDLDVAKAGEATLTLGLLPTFAVDSDHRLRYAVEFDGGKPVELVAAD